MKKFAADLNVNHNKSSTRRAVWFGLGLLVIFPVGFAAFTFLAVQTSNQSQIASPRAGWYLRSGQWRADVRTLAAAFEYVMDWVPGTPTGTSSPTNHLAALVTPNATDSLVVTQANSRRQNLPKS